MGDEPEEETMLGRKSSEEGTAGGRFAREPAATRGDAQTTTMPAEPGEEHADAHEQRDDAEAAAAPVATHAEGTVGRDEMRAIRARQRAEFGGFAWGSAFFGWLVAFGVAALLSGLLAAAGAATGVTDAAGQETIGLAGGIVLVAAVSLAYFCGGYVAGRLARFDGARNGLAVWLIGVLVTAGLGALALVAGSDYNVLDRANLPRLTVGDEAATTAGVIAMVGMLLLTAIAALSGGKVGERYHTKVDRHAVS